jgi:O-antigen ligase
MIDLKTLATITILSASFGIASSDFLIDVYRNLFNKFIPKPFGCSFCMAFWGGLIYSIYCGNGIIDSVMIASAGSILSTLINKYLYK